MKQILVIDDAATVRLYHRGILESGGYRVTEAVNGVEGLERVAETAFDLYFVDVNMPVLDGYGFLRELRSRDDPQPPAIMVSTEAGERDRRLALEVGASHYMVKPVRPETLLACARLLLGERSTP